MLKEREIIEGTQNPEELCQGVSANGPCSRKALPNSLYCAIHGGTVAEEQIRRADMYQFHRSEYMRNLAAQLPGFANGSTKFDLSEELGILRLQLQETLNKCENDLDFLRNNQKISNTVDQIRRTVESSLKLDHKLGNLLSKDEMILVAQNLIRTIEEHVTDPNTIQKIVTSFEEILKSQVVSRGLRGPYDKIGIAP